MFIYRENALKAHKHRSIQREHLKNNFNSKSHQNKSIRRIKLHIF